MVQDFLKNRNQLNSPLFNNQFCKSVNHFEGLKPAVMTFWFLRFTSCLLLANIAVVMTKSIF